MKPNNLKPHAENVERDAKLLHALFDHHQDAFLFIDENYRVQFFNAVAQKRAFFYQQREIKTGDDIHNFVLDADRVSFDEYFSKALHGETQTVIKRYEVEGRNFDLQFVFQSIGHHKDLKGVFFHVRDVTADQELIRIKNQTEAALRESEQRYKMLVERAFDAIYLIRNYNFEYVNKHYEALTGYTSEEVTHPDFDINSILTEKSKRVMDERFEARKRGETLPSNYEFQVKRKDGKVVDVEISTASLQTDGDVLVLGIMRDISDRIDARKALQREKAYFKHLFQSLPFGVVVLNNKDMVLDCNPGFLKMFGYEKNEVINKLINDIIVPDFLKDEGNYLTTDVASGKVIASETIRKTADGKLLQVSINGQPVKLPDGNKIIFGTYQDISDRKKTEQALTQERELMTALMDTIPDTIYFKDTGSNFLRVNRAQLEALGVQKQEEAIGKSDFDFFDHEHALRAFEQERAVMSHDKPLINHIEKVETSSGIHWFSATKVPLKNTHGEIIGLAGISRDISEMKQMEEVLLKNEKHLRELNAEKDKLFSIITHDLRSPFNSFIMLSEMFADEEYNLSLDEMRKMAQSMHKSASNLSDLLDNLLDWSRLQRDLFKTEKSRIKLHLLIDEALDAMSELIEQKKLSVQQDIPKNFKLIADNRMLSSIIRNLLSNAVKFTPSGGSIWISAGADATESCITVKDSGIGMPEKIRSKLFQIDGKVGRKGTDGEPTSGLGLILVKEFVDKHQGRIEIESEEHAGSSFKIIIPQFETED